MFYLSFGLSVCTCQSSPKRRVSRGTTDNYQQRVHLIYVNLTFFELSSNKIHATKSINITENLTDYIIHILHNISLNHLPHEVETFVRNCDTTNHQYDQCTLFGSSDCLLGSSGNPAINLGNMDFFSELTATPEDWPRLLASKQELLDELIVDEDYDPLDPSQRWLESRLRKSPLKNYVNYNDYNPFDSPNRLQHKSRKQKASDDDDDDYPSDASFSHQQHADQLQNYLINSLLTMIMTLLIHHSVGSNQGYGKDCRTTWQTMITILSPYSIILSNQENRKHPPLLTMMMIVLLHLLGISNIPTTIMRHLAEAPIQVHQLSKRNIISST